MLRGTLALAHDARDLALWIAACLEQRRDPTDATLLYCGSVEELRREPEPKLQALLRKELSEGLDRLGLPAKVIREPLEHGADKPDFVVRLGDHTEVPIEVKWADNDPEQGLAKQLFRRYMLGHLRRSHGVLFVGWTGTHEVEREQLRAKLNDLADGLRASDHRTVHVVVADLRHPRNRKP